MNTLSEWLQLMLAEITRKQEDAVRARAEEARRAAEEGGSAAPEHVERRKTFHSD
jgi:hypothetical protein